MKSGVRDVRVSGAAHRDLRSFFRSHRDRKLVWRQAKKLRFWPEKSPADEGGHLLDVDWDWVKACPGLKIGELRINDAIAGFDNWRIIFYEAGNEATVDEMAKIWLLMVLKKKRDYFTDTELAAMRSRRLVVRERYYNVR